MSDATAVPTRVIRGTRELRDAVGEELGVSRWYDVAQQEIDAFARATHDFNFLHVDPARAATTPMGGTIAHGLYTLSLGPKFNDEIVAFEGLGLRLNYGYNRVRFPAPLRVGSKVRMRLALAGVEELATGSQLTLTQTFERKGAERPVCVAEFLLRIVND